MNIKTTSRTCKILSACCLAVYLSALPSRGAAITVVNGDFSSPVLAPGGLANGIAGWTRDVTGSITFGGTVNPGPDPSESYPGITVGDQFGYNVWNPSLTGTLSYTQNLSAVLENNTLYTISLGVAQSISFALPTFTDGYSDDPGVNDIVIRLLAGGQVFGTFSSSVPISPGNLAPWVINQQSSDNEALVGQQLTLEIFLRKTSDATILFAMDNIAVNAEAIPEVGSSSLLIFAAGVVLLVTLRRKAGPKAA